MDLDFTGDVALVTGAARGLGRAIAAALAESGAAVGLADLDEAGARAVAGTLVQRGLAARAYALDVTDRAAVERTVAAVEADLGSITVLINNAGICGTAQILELDAEEWQRTLAVNLTGAFHCLQAVARGMVRRGGGRIVNIGSLAGRSGGILVSASYSASKAGVGGLTKAAAKQLARFHVNVNCVAPGTIETELIAGWDPDDVRALRESMPWGRMATVDDVTGAVLFLASRRAEYITGATLDVNGALYVAP